MFNRHTPLFELRDNVYLLKFDLAHRLERRHKVVITDEDIEHWQCPCSVKRTIKEKKKNEG